MEETPDRDGGRAGGVSPPERTSSCVGLGEGVLYVSDTWMGCVRGVVGGGLSGLEVTGKRRSRSGECDACVVGKEGELGAEELGWGAGRLDGADMGGLQGAHGGCEAACGGEGQRGGGEQSESLEGGSRGLLGR